MVFERKFEIYEKRRCAICSEEYEYDLIWLRQFNFRVRNKKLASESFHNLCPKHKIEFFGREIYWAYIRGFINDRDLEKLGIEVAYKFI